MLGRLIRELARRRDRAPQAGDAQAPEPPALQRLHRLRRAHEQAPLDRHLQILFDGIGAGGRPLLEVAAEAANATDSSIPPLKALHRRYSIHSLVRYFLHARRLPGLWAECGVFQGYSAYSLCLAAQSLDPGFDGSGLHLVDSFAGLSAPQAQDRHQVESDSGARVSARPVFGEGHFRTDADFVRRVFARFPGVRIHQGWVPQVLAELPEGSWSFVHVDVDLYEPTRGALEYFLPRLVPGGVIVCDDYGSDLFPGAERAWDEVLGGAGLPFVELPTGQAVLIRPGG